MNVSTPASTWMVRYAISSRCNPCLSIWFLLANSKFVYVLLLVVHILCHIEAASAVTDGTFLLFVPLVVFWARHSSAPIGSQL